MMKGEFLFELDCNYSLVIKLSQFLFIRTRIDEPKLDARDSYLVAAGFVPPGTNTPWSGGAFVVWDVPSNSQMESGRTARAMLR